MLVTNHPWQLFEDGKVYHYYHFHGMQLGIARDIKSLYVFSHYESRLLVMQDYEYVWVDPLIDGSQIELMSGAIGLNNSDISAALNGESGTITWRPIELARPASVAEVLWTAKITDGSTIKFEISFNGGATWIPVNPGEPILGDETQSLRLRASLTHQGVTDKPRIYDVAVFW